MISFHGVAVAFGLFCFLLLGIGIILPVFFHGTATRFRTWLQGSRTSYYINSTGMVAHTHWRLRTVNQWKIYGGVDIDASVIEISSGFWRRRSAIYGPAAKNWKIAGIYRIMMEVDCVELEGLSGVPVETALKIINAYPSLQAMLDRIAELEKNLKVANTRRVELRAMVRALLEVIQGDRQKYRSRAAQHIRVFLEEVEAQATMMNEPNPSIDQIEFWKKVAIINT